MALTVFLALSSVWFLGLVWLELQRVRLEGDDHPFGDVGAFASAFRSRVGNPAVQRVHRLTLAWLGAGAIVLVGATAIARALER